jgi:hypothetical protein
MLGARGSRARWRLAPDAWRCERPPRRRQHRLRGHHEVRPAQHSRSHRRRRHEHDLLYFGETGHLHFGPTGGGRTSDVMSPFGPLKWLCPRASVARPHTTPSRIAVRIRDGVSPAITSAVARAARSTRSSSRPEARTRREAQRASSRECRPGAHAKRGAHAAERRRMVRRVEHPRSYDDRARTVRTRQIIP